MSLKTCFNNVYICSNLSGWEIKFLLSYLVRNIQINTRNTCHYNTISKVLAQHSLIQCESFVRPYLDYEYAVYAKRNELGLESLVNCVCFIRSENLVYQNNLLRTYN